MEAAFKDSKTERSKIRQKIAVLLRPFVSPAENRLLGGAVVHLRRSGGRRVGLSEADARKKKIEYDVVRQEFAEVDRAVVESREAGFAKILL